MSLQLHDSGVYAVMFEEADEQKQKDTYQQVNVEQNDSHAEVLKRQGASVIATFKLFVKGVLVWKCED